MKLLVLLALAIVSALAVSDEFKWLEAKPPGVFKDDGGIWTIGNTQVQCGIKGDVPVPEDYFGEGSKRLAVWRPSNGNWYIKGSGYKDWGDSEGNLVIQCGKRGDIPVAGDYNGDGKISFAVWRPSNGNWYLKGPGTARWSETKENVEIQCGKAGDVPVPRDYFNEGKLRIAVWRPSNGIWYIKGKGNDRWSQSEGNLEIQCGLNGDVPVPGDYYGDGKIRLAVWRPSNGNWYIKGLGNDRWSNTKDNVVIQCGTRGDIPVPGDYFNEGKLRMAVYRPSTGLLYVKGNDMKSWGSSSGNVVFPKEGGPKHQIPVNVQTRGCPKCSEINSDIYKRLDTVYHVADATVTQMRPTAVGHKTIRNGGSRDQSMAMGISETVTETMSFSHTAGASVTVGTEFKCGVPFIASGSVSVEVTASYEFSYGTEKSVEKSMNADFVCVGPPKLKTVCEAVLIKDKVTVPYTMTWALKNDETCTCETKGEFKEIAANRLDLTVEEFDLETGEPVRRTKREISTSMSGGFENYLV